tara:strand:+ start:408 stop:935 length:528 start_codon:yes stop_codon:yes gene_type:complete
MQKAKIETIVTPVGVASYSWLQKPDTAFNQNHYKVTLLLDKKDNDNKKFVKRLNDLHKEFAHGKETKSPIKDGDTDGKEGQEGMFVFTAKSQFPPKLIDTQRHELAGDKSPMSGDMIRVAMGLAPYDTGSNAGLSLRLKAVQLVDKRNKGSDVSHVFDDIDGFVSDEIDDEETDF